MELNLQPLAPGCFVTGQPFAEGQRVTSFLVRAGPSAEVIRHDMLESAVPEYRAPGQVACSWVQVFKSRPAGENRARAMRLTAENLFVTLAGPSAEPTPENIRLVRFLALMLERKKLLRPRGRSTDGSRDVYEHARTKQLYEVPVGELDPQFFLQVQAQLSILIGTPEAKAEVPQPAAV